MGLPLPTKTVEISDGVTVAVRGFSFDDALGLYRHHAGELSALFEHFAQQGTITADDVTFVTENVISQAPGVVAEIIATALVAPEPFEEKITWARAAPLGVQFAALERIHELTFTSEMPPGKFLAAVIRMAQSTAATVMQGRAA